MVEHLADCPCGDCKVMRLQVVRTIFSAQDRSGVVDRVRKPLQRTKMYEIDDLTAYLKDLHG